MTRQALNPIRPIAAALVAASLIAFAVPALAAGETEPASREQVLDGLFEKLAVAKDKDSADLVAASIWRVWLDSGSDTIDLLTRRAIKAIDEKENEVALQILDEVVELAPDYAEGWNRRATVHYAMHHYGAAIHDVERTLALEPRHFGAMSGLGAMLKEIGRDDAALAIYRKALALHPYLPDALKAIDELADEVDGREI